MEMKVTEVTDCSQVERVKGCYCPVRVGYKFSPGILGFDLYADDEHKDLFINFYGNELRIESLNGLMYFEKQLFPSN